VEIFSVPDICVVHLVRKKNGIEPFQSFLASYLGNSAGIDHKLLIVYKGFFRKADIDPYEELLREVPHSFLTITDLGFDLRSYFIAAEKCSSKYCCFLNSFSIILDKDWLLKLYQHISQPGVGLVGVTGSWQSFCPRQEVYNKNMAYWKKLVRPMAMFILRGFFGMYFDYFPNYHIRTNGFMIERDVMLKISRGMIIIKIQVYFIESGKHSITRQVELMGFRPIVVGKNGRGYEKHEWNISSTFWRGVQENLLISDNQTRLYDKEDSDKKKKREFFAWGSNVVRSLDQ
jgi:hypothetical protein